MNECIWLHTYKNSRKIHTCTHKCTQIHTEYMHIMHYISQLYRLICMHNSLAFPSNNTFSYTLLVFSFVPVTTGRDGDLPLPFFFRLLNGDHVIIDAIQLMETDGEQLEISSRWINVDQRYYALNVATFIRSIMLLFSLIPSYKLFSWTPLSSFVYITPHCWP